VVQQVPELVEERLHVSVLHERRRARCRAREVAHEHALREPHVPLPRGERELGVVLVLPLPRVHVEVDASQQPPVLDHVVGLHLRMPDRRLGGPVGDAEEPPGDGQDAVLHPAVLEIGPHGL
jgi:hypothetical protein